MTQNTPILTLLNKGTIKDRRWCRRRNTPLHRRPGRRPDSLKAVWLLCAAAASSTSAATHQAYAFNHHHHRS
ncbi:hypothetical protein LINPERHAP2_LOCUS36950 [Linum perenne]